MCGTSLSSLVPSCRANARPQTVSSVAHSHTFPKADVVSCSTRRCGNEGLDAGNGVSPAAVAAGDVVVGDDPAPAIPARTQLYFRFVDVKPSAGHFVKLAPAAGRSRLAKEEVLVSILRLVSGHQPGHTAVSLESTGLSVLPRVTTRWDHIQEMQMWTSGDTFYSLSSLQDDAGTTEPPHLK